MRKIIIILAVPIISGFFAAAAYAQSDSNHVDVNQPGDSNSVKHKKDSAARRKRGQAIRRKTQMKKWRKLRVGMTQIEVKRALKKPKLTQDGFDTCTWYYQAIPEPNQKNMPGSVIFRAKTPEQLCKEAETEALKKLSALINRRVAKCRRCSGISLRYSPEDYSLPPVTHNARESDNKQADLQNRARFNGLYNKIVRQYDRAVEKINHRLHRPEFVVSSFNLPDWNKTK